RSIPKKNRRLTPRLALTSSAKRSVRNVGATFSTHPGHVLSPQQDPSPRSPQGRLIDPHRTTYEASLSSLQKKRQKYFRDPQLARWRNDVSWPGQDMGTLP
ncbi:unnamed protein product, partial [Musa acuminata subsp. burmannicoides]